MSLTSVSQKNLAFFYDFSVDGGAIGVINTGLFVAAGTLLKFTNTGTRVTLVGAGAIISIGTISTPGSFVNAVAVGAFFGAGFGNLFVNNPRVVVPLASEVIFTIAVAPLTAGILLVILDCLEPTQ